MTGPPDPSSTPASPREPSAPPALLCPRCGYDLRGTAADRCSECGLTIDRAALAASGLPWAHRRVVGRPRAFAATVWLVTLDRPRVRDELSKPQDPRDAAWFRVWVTACVASALCGLAAAAVAEHGLVAVAVQPGPIFSGFATGAAALVAEGGHAQDAAVPWCAGATLGPAIPVYLLLLALYLTGVGRAAMRPPPQAEDLRERARAVGLYAAAPLVWLLPAAALHAGAFGLRLLAADAGSAAGEVGSTTRAAALGAEVLAAAVAATAAFAAVRRGGEWATRARHAGVGRFAFAAGEILVRSLVGVGLLLGVVPWCVGLLRILNAA